MSSPEEMALVLSTGLSVQFDKKMVTMFFSINKIREVCYHCGTLKDSKNVITLAFLFLLCRVFIAVPVLL